MAPFPLWNIFLFQVLFSDASRQPRRDRELMSETFATVDVHIAKEQQAVKGFDAIGKGFCRSNACTGTGCPTPWYGEASCISLEQCSQECFKNSECAAFAWTKKHSKDYHKCGRGQRCVQYFGVETVATKTSGTYKEYTCYAKGSMSQFDLGNWMDMLQDTPQGGYACGYKDGWCGCSCGHNQGNTTPCHLPRMRPGTQGGHTCGYYGKLYGCAEAHNTLEGCPRTRLSHR